MKLFKYLMNFTIWTEEEIKLYSRYLNCFDNRECLVYIFKQQILIFKHYYTYFYIFFLSIYISQILLNNNFQFLNPPNALDILFLRHYCVKYGWICRKLGMVMVVRFYPVFALKSCTFGKMESRSSSSVILMMWVCQYRWGLKQETSSLKLLFIIYILFISFGSGE